MAESSCESVWNCLNFSPITWYHSFLNYYWNSDEFSQYSEKFRFVFQKNSGLRFNCSECWLKCLLNVSELWLNIVLWICLNFSWITFLNYYWNSDEFSQYLEKFRFAFQKTLVHIHFWIITEIWTNSANIQKNSDLRFRKIQTKNLCLSESWLNHQPIFIKVQICFSEQFRQKLSAVNQKYPTLAPAPLTMHRPDIPIILKPARIHFKK